MSTSENEEIFTESLFKAAAASIGSAAKKSNVYIAECPTLDKGGERNVPDFVLEKLLDAVAVVAPNTNVMIIAGGKTECTVAARIVDSRYSARKWIENSTPNFTFNLNFDSVGNISVAIGKFECEFPFKQKDTVRTESFAAFKKSDLFESDSEESSENIACTYNINNDFE